MCSMNADIDQRKRALRLAIDALRGYFREMAEPRNLEARRFQTELEKIAATVFVESNTTGLSMPSTPYWRRWRVKS
jgi:hypothetical protein